jgi:hypothetical protein
MSSHDALTAAHSRADTLGAEKVLTAPVVPLYHLENYSFGTKDAQLEKDPNMAVRMQRHEKVSTGLHTSDAGKPSCAHADAQSPLVCNSGRTTMRMAPSHSGRSAACAQPWPSAHPAAASRPELLQTVRWSLPSGVDVMPIRCVCVLMGCCVRRCLYVLPQSWWSLASW